ncbi:hypothetical protein COCON_G00202980 [Conger conger]|uniref:LITAF domain-containing protein n=1 Tax=Conger conger TaxID=82655 RepID=A0A9Q1HQ00_CONCO|nr:hypothetical protein COCON_G00202980 [Conger conger]
MLCRTYKRKRRTIYRLPNITRDGRLELSFRRIGTMATAPPLMEFPQPPSYEETMVAPPPPHYHMGPPPSQGYAPGPSVPQGYAPGPSGPQGYAPGPSGPQGYAPGPPGPQGYAAGPPAPQGYAPGPPAPQGYAPGPPAPQGYAPGPPAPQGYTKVPQHPYPPQPVSPPLTSPVVSVQTVYVQPGVIFGDRPVQTHCPACTQFVLTRTEFQAGTITWLSCLALSFFGCFYGCCLIPFCADSLKDVKHFCPNCSNYLGVYRRL